MCSLTSSFYYSDGERCVPARLTNLRRKRSSAMCLLLFRYTANILNLFYVFDGNKNASAVFYRMNSNGIGAHYDYSPFGATIRTHRDSRASFDIVALNPFRFSSEYYDSELNLVYCNYRQTFP